MKYIIRDIYEPKYSILHILDMAKNSKTPLSVLRKGLDTLRRQVQTWKASLEAKLRQKEKLTDADEHWLDNDGNVVNEQCVLETLEAASDYERGFEKLDEADKGVVRWLRELAGDLSSKVVGNKRKTAGRRLAFFLYPQP